MNRQLTASHPRASWFSLFPLLTVGLLGFALVTVIGPLTTKKLVLGLGGLSFVAAAFLSGRPKTFFLGAWVFALTYNRQYFVFSRLVGDQGGQGPYVVAADGCLLVLLALWGYEAIVLKRFAKPRGARAWPWLLPFFMICLVSALSAAHTNWSLFEMIRLLRIGLVLAYFRYQVRRPEWWACALAVALAVSAQSALGVAEIITGRSGLTGVLGGASLEDTGPAVLRQESFLGFRRATATMTHPPNLACYLLMTIPMLLGLGAAAKDRWIRRGGWITGLLGLCGLGCTLSRGPWVIVVGQVLLLLAGLAGMRLISPARTVGLTTIGLLVVTAAAFPFADRIADRITRDWDRSVDFRVKENSVGLRIATANPFLGVGPNNYGNELIKLDPEWEWALQFEDFSIHQLHIRPLASPHNGFLLIAAETGLLGLLTFLLFIAGIAGFGIRALRRTSGDTRIVCYGLLVGLVGLLLQQTIDFSMWVDPLLYTLALTAGLLNAAPSIDESETGVAA